MYFGGIAVLHPLEHQNPMTVYSNLLDALRVSDPEHAMVRFGVHWPIFEQLPACCCRNLHRLVRRIPVQGSISRKFLWKRDKAGDSRTSTQDVDNLRTLGSYTRLATTP
jgi:hypothetical protein